jgi:MFS family permease
LKSTFKALESRDFRLVWAGAMISSIGTWMQTAAQSWLVLQISGSSVLLGLDGFLQGIPIVLFTLFGGVIADRADRRKLLLGSQTVQMACALVLTVLIWTRTVDVWHILAMSFVTGCAQAFGGPAYQALIPSIVPRDSLPNAIAMNSVQFNLARIIGPVLAGFALNSLGGQWCFLLNGLSFLAPITSLAVVRPNFTPSSTKDSIFDSMKQGFDFIRHREGMVVLIAIAFIMTFFGLPLVQFLPVFVKQVYDGGPQLFTSLLALSGLGSVGGALIAASINRKAGKGKVALILLAALGFLIIGFALSTWLPLTMLLIFCAGGILMGAFQMVASLVQEISTDQMRGRVMSIYNLAFRGGMPVGSFITGELMHFVAAPLVLALEGALLVAAMAYFAIRHPRITKI